MRVRLSEDFFKKEREQTYADWRLSVWRELFQNSIDQNASEIRIGLTETRDGFVRLTFADNGPGMTREVLEDVYFAIGATTKTGNQIGGMGRARVLTCFAMQSYEIRSQGYRVRGQGGEYQVEDGLPLVRGCELTIMVDDSTETQLRNCLLRFLDESRIAARLYLNGNLITRQSAIRGRHVRDLVAESTNFAKVYVNKSQASHRVIVRVNGVSMYTTMTSAKAQVIVELEPSISRKVLTSNRDGMHWAYRRVLDNFLMELAVDTHSSLRPRFTRHTTVARGGGMRRIARSKTAPVPQRPTLVVVNSPETGLDEVSVVDQGFGNLIKFVTAAPSSGAVLPHDAADTFTETRLFSHWLASTFGDIYIFDETENATMHRAVTGYLPENWQLTTTVNGRTYRKGANSMRVLLMWQTAIAYALEVALEPLQVDDVSYAVGFVFGDEKRADHRQEASGHVFSLCPVNKAGKLLYSISNKRDLKKLMSLAKHEVTHVAKSAHDEDFATLREDIDMLFDESECFRRMKDAVRNIRNIPMEDTPRPDWAADIRRRSL